MNTLTFLSSLLHSSTLSCSHTQLFASHYLSCSHAQFSTSQRFCCSIMPLTSLFVTHKSQLSVSRASLCLCCLSLLQFMEGGNRLEAASTSSKALASMGGSNASVESVSNAVKHKILHRIRREVKDRNTTLPKGKKH